ncbi:MAG: UPF0280 family protein [Granulosicoccus sp.]|nr:UPF0280 family protein [Granulosicoccus sp.]
MTDGAQINWLPDGRRVHFHHGPIDLVVEVQGGKDDCTDAMQQASEIFPQVLPELVRELEFLRSPINSMRAAPAGAVAKKMVEAAKMHAARHFVTPMISVAGAVADYMLQTLIAERLLSRAYVNNGGDIAIFLNEGETFDIAICEHISTQGFNSTLRLDAASGVGGVATSGWRGRSHSLGIADAVTVLSHNAASADAAATLIANAVNLPASPKVIRLPADELLPDSDLGTLPVTVSVESLNDEEATQAINNGAGVALQMLKTGSIKGVLIALQGKTRVLGSVLNSQLASA